MPNLNKVMLMGHLGKDPELKFTPSGKAVCNFSIATSEKYKDKETTTWHNIVAWGKQAETIKEYMTKGSAIYIEGRIDNRTYEKKDGSKGYISEVVVKEFKFLGSKETTDQSQSNDDDDLPF